MRGEHASSKPVPPEGYSVRAPEPDELRAVYDLILACDLAEYGVTDLTEEELRADWEDPQADRWVVLSTQGALAGFGSLSSPSRGESEEEPIRHDVECYVHPDHAGKGIGRQLLRLTEARVQERLYFEPGAGPDYILTNTVNGANASALQLLESEGYAPVRHFLRMEIDFRGAPPAPEPPTGITVQPCASEDEELAAFAAVEEAFRDHWGHGPSTLPSWLRRRRLAGAEAGRWLTAKAEDETAGTVFCGLPPEGGRGEIEWLAVRRPWRRQGVGQTLLRAALSEIRDHGGHGAGLVVDSESPTGAGRLYGRAGMRTVRHYAVHRKALHRALG